MSRLARRERDQSRKHHHLTIFAPHSNLRAGPSPRDADVLRAGRRQQRGERAAELATLRQDLNALREHNRLMGVEPQRPYDPRPTWSQEFDVKMAGDNIWGDGGFLTSRKARDVDCLGAGRERCLQLACAVGCVLTRCGHYLLRRRCLRAGRRHHRDKRCDASKCQRSDKRGQRGRVSQG